MARISYQIIGVRELSLNLSRAQKRFIPLVRARMVDEIAKEIRERAPRWQGELRNSTVADATGGEVRVESPYATFVEEGTRAGYFPNIANITPWAEAHGIPPGALAQSIQLRGTRAQPFVAPAVQAVENRAARLAEEVFAKLGVA